MHRISTFCLAAASASLVAAPSASAATPVGGALYGGGARTASGDFAEYTTIRVQDGAKKLNFYGEWSLRCDGGGQDMAFVTAEDVKVDRDGSFSGTGEISGEGPLGSQAGDYRFAGRFTGRHVATGTARADVRQTLTAGGGADCGTGRFRFTVIDATQEDAVAGPKGGAQYFGSTSQTYPAILRLDGRGRDLRYASLEYELVCDGQEQPLLLDERMPGRFIELRRDGRFSGRETFTDSATVAGNRLEITAVLDGAFGRDKLRGTWKMTGRVLDPETGEQVGSCTSEDIAFRAARR